MGESLCKPTTHDFALYNDPFKFQQSSDSQQQNVVHGQRLRASNPELQKILESYESFLNQQKSMYRDPLLKSDFITLKAKDRQVKCKYERPYKFIPGGDRSTPYRIFNSDSHSRMCPDDIRVRDPVMQYFGVFLCFLSEHQRMIRDLILTEENNYGLQVVAVNAKGHQEFILIDDLILCENSVPRFSQPVILNGNYERPYLWPCILEKAWLKLKGSAMKKIVRVTPQQVFEAFLPYPMQKITFEGDQEQSVVRKVKKYLYKLDEGNACILTSKDEPRHRIGLSGRNNFYFLRSFNFDGRRLFYLRNPCGNFDFRGSYFDIPQNVRGVMSQDLGVDNVPEGNFLLDEEEFIEQMSYATILHYKNGAQTTSESIVFEPNKQFFIAFELKQSAPLCLRLIQYSSSASRGTNLDNYYPLTYHLINTNERKFLGGLDNEQACFGVKNSYFLPQVVRTVNAGKYILRVKKKGVHNSYYTNDCVLIANFSAPIRFSYANQQEISKRYQGFLLEYTRQELAQKQTHQPAIRQTRKGDVEHVISWYGDIVVLYIEKTNLKKDFANVQISFPEITNLECISHPEIRKGEYNSYQVQNSMLVIFEKKDLTEETQIHKYVVESY